MIDSIPSVDVNTGRDRWQPRWSTTENTIITCQLIYNNKNSKLYKYRKITETH